MPDKFHSISKFNLETGEKLSKSKKDYSAVLGEELVRLAKKDDKIVAVTAAMKDGTGLSNFEREFPDRFFDVGIAEQHAISMVSGMAKEGLKPVLPIYSSFLQRGYDQLIHDMCIQNLPVTVCIDRAGIVGNDGETHQGIYDLSFLNTIPNMNIMAPKNFEELRKMLEFSINSKLPMAIRYPKGGEDDCEFEMMDEIKLGTSELIREGRDITICAIGKMVSYSKRVAEILEKEGISCEVINVRFLKPLDSKAIIKSVQKTKRIITIEDNSLSGGLGSSVNNVLINKDVEILNMGYPDVFVKHGSIEELERLYEMDVEGLVKKVREKCKEKINN